MIKLLNLQKTLLVVMIFAIELNAYSQCALPPKPVLKNPTSSSINCEGFTASWLSVTGITGYRFDLSTTPNFTSFVPGYENLPVNTLSKVITGLAAGRYYYRLRTVNNCGSSDNSDPKSVNIERPVGGTSRPENSYSDQAYVCNGIYGPTIVEDFVGIIGGWKISYDNINWSDGWPAGNMDPTKGDTLRIKAVIQKSGCEAFSTVTTYISIAKPSGPVLENVSDLGCSWFVLNWQSLPEATEYVLDVATDSAFKNKLPGYIGLRTSDVTQWVEGLFGGTKYYYRVMALVPCGSTENSLGQIKIPVEPSGEFSYPGNPYCNWNISNNPLLKVLNPQPQFVKDSIEGNFSAVPPGLVINDSTGEIDIQASAAGTYTVIYTVESKIGCGIAISSTEVTIREGVNFTIEEISLDPVRDRTFYRIKESTIDPSWMDSTKYEITWTHITSEGKLSPSTDPITPWESVGKRKFAYFVKNNPSTGTPRTADALCVDVINKATGCLTRKCAGANTSSLPSPGNTFRKEQIEELVITERRQENDVRLYPNPASNSLIVEFQTGGQSTVQLRNLNGLLIKEVKGMGESVMVDISHLSTGLYLVYIVHENTIIRKKVEVIR